MLLEQPRRPGGTATAPHASVHLSIYSLVLLPALAVPLRRRAVNSRKCAAAVIRNNSARDD
nr:unnamed protein product [Callosobruchus chinensis]